MNYRAELDQNVLTLENDYIRRRYAWNGGHLVSLRIDDVMRGHGWDLNGDVPDFNPFSAESRPAWPPDVDGGDLVVVEQTATSITPAHLRVEVTTAVGELEIKRVFRLYPGCPAIACDLYLRGHSDGLTADATLEHLVLPGIHWRATAVAFLDVTDRHNTLIKEHAILPYRFAEAMEGNLLFLDELLDDRGLFILKEAPAYGAQLRYPGHDFVVQAGSVRLVGPGVVADDLDPQAWTRAYGFVTGVTGGGKLGRYQALRTYQTQIRVHEPGRDDMVLMNTWGDRSQDTRLGEAFALVELEAGARLGISHLQLDDGWQTGRSSNSAFEGGSLEDIWSQADYWQPHPERFPRGLQPVVTRGEELGIEVCLWFNPSKDDDYAHWEDDAATLIDLYRTHGIRTFKIDGVQVPTKDAEMNLRRMFDTVRAATDDDVVFNLDVTAGQRYGYHYFNEYGNIFLENRYTDWVNYYPHWTLRNVWMLSRYVPPQNLQIEFLNVWRNADKYGEDDPLAPVNVPFEYAFAITMMAQPLAWFEVTGLPAQAFEIGDIIRTYREHQTQIHKGQIFPVGEVPSGTGWTGFQSLRGESGYLQLFREYNDRPTARIRLHGLARRRLRLHRLLGAGQDQVVSADEEGTIEISLPHRYAYVLYRYQVQDVATE